MGAPPATRGLTDKQAAFVRHMSELGDQEAAVRLAGYETENWSAISYTLLRTPHVVAALQVETRRKIITAAPVALKLIIELIKDDKVAHKTRLDAAWKLTQMAGHVAPRAALEKPADTPLHEMTTDQLRELAGRLEDEIAGRAKTVSSAELAPPDAQATDLVG